MQGILYVEGTFRGHCGHDHTFECMILILANEVSFYTFHCELVYVFIDPTKNHKNWCSRK
jgi:hypothetical protein